MLAPQLGERVSLPSESSRHVRIGAQLLLQHLERYAFIEAEVHCLVDHSCSSLADRPFNAVLASNDIAGSERYLSGTATGPAQSDPSRLMTRRLPTLPRI